MMRRGDRLAGSPPGPVWLRSLFDVMLVAAAFAHDWNTWLRFEVGAPAGWWSVYLLHSCVLAVLLLRWRRPMAVLLVQLGYAILLAQILPMADFVGGLLIGLHTVARQLAPRVSVPAALVCTLLIVLNGHRSSWDLFYYATDPLDIGFAGAVYTISPAVVWMLGYWSRLAALQRAEAEAVARARRADRLQTARDLHDILSHTVTVMLLQAAGARAVLADSPDRARLALDAVQEAGVQAMAELRRMLELMRLPADAEPAGDGFQQPGLEQLDPLVQQMRATGLTIAVETAGTPARLAKSVDVTAYHVVQEALTNSTKHAAPGCEVTVRFDWRDESLQITVTDCAGGRQRRTRAVVPSTGNGLLGLRERVSAIGGELTAEPHADGFVVTATLPTASTTADKAA